MLRYSRIISLIVYTIFGTSLTMGGSESSPISFSFSNSIDGKYISEGRNILEKGGITTFNSDISYKLFDFNIWYGNGVQSRYNELQCTCGLSIDISEFGISFGYTDISFMQDNTSDQEIYFEITNSSLAWLSLSLSNVYSMEADGVFSELALEFSIPGNFERIDFIPFITQGFDFGYIEETNCLNNLQFGIIISHRIHKNLSINGHVTNSIGMWDNSKRENNFWGGVNLSTNF